MVSNRITEILTVTTYNATPRGLRDGHSLCIATGHSRARWLLSPLRTIITHATAPQLYHSPTDTDYWWFSALFGLGPPAHRASRVSLVTSNGAPYRTGLPSHLSNMDTLQ